jgi:GTPase SAR1 family protein
MSFNNKVLKIIVVGDRKSGKTSFIGSFMNNPKPENPSRERLYYKNETYEIVFQEIEDSGLVPSFYKDAVAAFLIFDITNQNLLTIHHWKHDLNLKVRCPNGMPIPVLLIGNKMDLHDDKWALKEKSLYNIAVENDFCGYCAVNSKKGTKVETIVFNLLQFIIEKKLVPSSELKTSVNLNKTIQTQNCSSCC